MCLDFEHRSLFFKYMVNHMTKYRVLTATCSVNVVGLILLFGSILSMGSIILCTRVCTVILAPFGIMRYYYSF